MKACGRGCTGRRTGPSPAPGRECGHAGGTVSARHQMQRQALLRPAVDQTQKLQPLGVSVPRWHIEIHAVVQRVQGGEQRGRPVTLVVLGDGARGPFSSAIPAAPG